MISPTGEEKSPFVRDTFKRLSAKPFEKDGKNYGPYKVEWERSRENLEADLCDSLHLADDGDAKNARADVLARVQAPRAKRRGAMG